MTDDLILLASAYLDGEATPDERALVEADPSLLDEVERLRTARTALLDPTGFEQPGDDVREAAITAALMAWDVAALDTAGSASDSLASAARPGVRRPVVVPLVRRHASYTRWLGAAAAVVAVLGLGVVIAQFDGGEGTDDSAAIEAPDDTASAEARTEFEQSAPPSDTTGALLSGDDAAEDAGDAAPDSDAVAGADVPTAAPAATLAAESAAVPEASLETPEELATFAATAERAFDSQTRDALIPSCAGEESDGIEYVATGTYRGEPVVIGIDAEREGAIAIDPDTCQIVAEAPLP
jgi:hypothetical protein